jgi:predicted dehydrogenase
MNRRRFVTLAASAASAVSLSAADSEPIGIGFLGASYSHFKGKFDVIRESHDFRLIGIAEQDPKIRASLEKAGVHLLSRDELLSHNQIKVIAVESDVPDHAADARAVLMAGKELHLEKAPAYRYSEFEEIVRMARARNRLLQVGYMWRYHPGINKALEAARNGWLGSVYMVRASISNQLEPARRPEWGRFEGGPMFELGGHVIDPMVRLMGRTERVHTILQKELPLDDKLHDNTLATLEWDHAIGMVHACNLQADSNRYRAFEIFGTNGCAVVNPIEPPGMTIDLAKAAGPYQKGVQTLPMSSYRRFVDDFADLAAAIRGEHPLQTTPDQDLLVEEMLLRCSGMYGQVKTQRS